MIKTTAILIAAGLVILPLCAQAQNYQTTLQSPNQLTCRVEFSSSELRFGTLNDYQTVELQDGLPIAVIGKPMLVGREIRLALPAGMAVEHVRVVETVTETIPGDFNICPAQPFQRTDGSDRDQPFIAPDAAVYNSEDAYPGMVVNFIRQTDLAGQPMAVVQIYPLQYFPQNRKLELSTSVTFALTLADGYTCGDYLPATISEDARRNYESRIKEMVANPEYATATTAALSLPRSPNLPDDGPFEHVIITSTTYESNWSALNDWYTRRGLRSGVVTTTYIYSNYSGADNQEKIRNFVIAAHSGWGAQYFLMAGENITVPFEFRNYADENTPSDMYYSDYDDDWTDEVYVGRAPIDNATQITTFINKVLKYEKTPALTDYPLEVLLIGMDLDESTPTEDLKETVSGSIPARFSITKVYDSDGTNHETDAKNAINAGMNLINHSDHSNWYVMGVGDRNHNLSLVSSEVDAFTNNDRMSVVVSLGCWPNAMDYSDCIAEHFVVYNSSQAAAAFTGNTRSGLYYQGYMNYLSSKIDRDWWRALFTYDKYVIGQTLADCRTRFGTDPWNPDAGRHCQWTFNLQGEPAMPIWTDTPESLQVTFPAEISTTTDYIDIHVATTGGSNVNQAYVCLWKGDEAYERGYTDVSGDLTFIAPLMTEGELAITVTKHNCLPFADSITVGQGCDCGVWGDANGDGEINPVDIVYMVNFVYRDQDSRIVLPDCTFGVGDVNCDGEVNPVDIVYYAAYVYNNITPFPCTDPCGL